MASAFSDDMRREFDEIFARYPNRAAAILPILHIVQREHGYISAESEEEVAELLSMPPVKVHEVLTFYHMLHAEPVGKHHIQFCRTLPCALRGAKALIDHAKQKLKLGAHEVSDDKRVSFEGVECIAACGNAPALQVNEKYYFDVTPEKLDQILDELD